MFNMFIPLLNTILFIVGLLFSIVVLNNDRSVLMIDYFIVASLFHGMLTFRGYLMPKLSL